MALSFFSNRSQKETVTLLVDIGSSSIGIALVKIEGNGIPHILLNVREDISFQGVLSSARFLLAMNRTLEKALKVVQIKMRELGSASTTNFTSSPLHIFCTLSSPWFILKSRNLHIAREQEFIVSERVLDEFINEDIERLKVDLKETLPPNDVRIIEKKIIQMKLNGYEIKNPYGQKTSKIELSMNIGVSSGKVIESVERTIGNFFHSKSIHFGAFPIAAFSAIRDIFPTERSFLFLDITGEATDVSLVNNDILVGTVAFSRGKNFLIREISTEMRTVHEEATTLFEMFLRNELDVEKSSQVENIINNALVEWLSRFEKAINSLSINGALPRKIFFTTDATIAPMFEKIIIDAKPEYVGNGPFEVQYLDQHIVAKFVTFESGVVRDPFIVVESLLAEKIIAQHI